MRYRKDVVRQVLDIMKEGPIPLRDSKPAEKVKTGAELFQDCHQGYVVTDSSDKLVDRVHEHNSTYPKLKDELDKRRSTSKAPVLANYAGLCVSKSQAKPRRPSKSKWERPKRNARRKKENRGVGIKPRARKTARRYSSKKVFPHRSCKRLNVGCQCSSLKKARNRMNGTDDILTFDLSIPKSTNFAQMDVFVKSQSVIQPKSSQHGGSIKSLFRKTDGEDDNDNSNYAIASVENPDTSDPSISSYNSFDLADQEPMV